MSIVNQGKSAGIHIFKIIYNELDAVCRSDSIQCVSLERFVAPSMLKRNNFSNEQREVVLHLWDVPWKANSKHG